MDSQKNPETGSTCSQKLKNIFEHSETQLESKETKAQNLTNQNCTKYATELRKEADNLWIYEQLVIP